MENYVNLNTTLYAINRDSRKGDIDTHDYLVYKMTGFVTCRTYFIIEFFGVHASVLGSSYTPSTYTTELFSLSTKRGKEPIESLKEEIISVRNNSIVYIITESLSIESITKLLNLNKGYSFNKLDLIDNLYKLIKGERDSIESQIETLNNKKSVIDTDIANVLKLIK